MPCGAGGLLGDAHDAADVLVFQAHLVENEEEGVVGGLGLIFLLETAEGGEGQASAIKARNQVSEYPPLSKLAGCFLYPGTGCKVTTKITFLALFFLLFSHFRRFPLFIYLSIPLNLDILPVTSSLSTYYIMGRNDYLCSEES